MLHESLREIAPEARACTTEAMARGILLESHDLLRNAVAHDDDAAELTPWFSRLVRDVISSPALAGPAVSGSFARGEGVPTSPVVLTQPHEHTEELLRRCGFKVQVIPVGDEHACDAAAVAMRADAQLPLPEDAAQVLLRDALAHRPPVVHTHGGLPTKDRPIDIHQDLIVPAVKIARWAGVAAACPEVGTPQRCRSGALTSMEADYLYQAWSAGLKLQLQRWAEHMHANVWEDLPQVHRALVGASCRSISDVAQSIAARTGVAL